LPAEFCDHFNIADNVAIELIELVGGYPVLSMMGPAHGFDFKTFEEGLSYTKARDITTFRVVIFSIPVPSNWVAYSSVRTG
jgi:hypothetical protein